MVVFKKRNSKRETKRGAITWPQTNKPLLHPLGLKGWNKVPQLLFLQVYPNLAVG